MHRLKKGGFLSRSLVFLSESLLPRGPFFRKESLQPNPLAVSVQQVSRDGNSEYQGISTEHAQRILDALGVRFRLEVEGPIPQDDNDQETVPA